MKTIGKQQGNNVCSLITVTFSSATIAVTVKKKCYFSFFVEISEAKEKNVKNRKIKSSKLMNIF